MYYYEVMEKVLQHHEAVEKLGYTVVLTALVGSQNYGLDDEYSDIDTFSLILPSLRELSDARKPEAGEFEVEDGKCMYKDIREALNLLKKPSPNSVEMFSTYYIHFNPLYKDIALKYLDGRNLQYMVHSDYSHMLTACAGMAHQLTKRNMPSGKRYAHALRLVLLVYKYTESLDVRNLFKLSGETRINARAAKRDKERNEWYDQQCEQISNDLDKFKAKFTTTITQKMYEKIGKELIELFQIELIKRHLEVIR